MADLTGALLVGAPYTAIAVMVAGEGCARAVAAGGWAALADDDTWAWHLACGVLWPVTGVVLAAKAAIAWRARHIKGA